jgi:hypothetical protein
VAKKLRCYLGFHSWVERVNDGERYMTCRHCGTYTDKASSIVRYGGQR